MLIMHARPIKTLFVFAVMVLVSAFPGWDLASGASALTLPFIKGVTASGDGSTAVVEVTTPAGAQKHHSATPSDATSGQVGSAPNSSVHSDSIEIDPCFYLPASDAESRTAGFDPSKGTVSLARCPHQSSVPGLPDGVTWRGDYVFAANGAPAAVAPPPDASELAQEATGLLRVPTPLVHMGPDPAVVAVKIPVWLWIEDPRTLTATVSAGGLSVTATAKVTSTVWSMGEPAGDSPDRLGGPVAAFTCDGLGSAPPGPVVDRSVTPPCGYTFIWRSLPERTGGSGAWPVSVVAKWTVSWVATNGQNGQLPLQATAQVGVHVGEWRTVLVAPDGPGLAAAPTR